jgi:formylglycine-generating enzyme required for sulfatase activity
MGNNPSRFNGDGYGADLNRPVELVSSADATNYCAKLTERGRLAGRIGTNAVYRLPTEAEWEYACRAWTSTRFSHGDDIGYTNLTNYAWYAESSGGQTHPVGQKLPNPWGLYDMHGNVCEWCQDWYGDYVGGIAVGPQGPAAPGTIRMFRGGEYGYYARNCRSACRNGDSPGNRLHFVGFRAVLAPGQP